MEPGHRVWQTVCPSDLPLALEYYARQSYARRELTVVDGCDDFAAEEGLVAALGGRILRVRPGTPLGIKLNLGVEAARGPLINEDGRRRLLCPRVPGDHGIGADPEFQPGVSAYPGLSEGVPLLRLGTLGDTPVEREQCARGNTPLLRLALAWFRREGRWGYSRGGRVRLRSLASRPGEPPRR